MIELKTYVYRNWVTLLIVALLFCLGCVQFNLIYKHHYGGIKIIKGKVFNRSDKTSHSLPVNLVLYSFEEVNEGQSENDVDSTEVPFAVFISTISVCSYHQINLWYEALYSKINNSAYFSFLEFNLNKVVSNHFFRL